MVKESTEQDVIYLYSSRSLRIEKEKELSSGDANVERMETLLQMLQFIQCRHKFCDVVFEILLSQETTS